MRRIKACMEIASRDSSNENEAARALRQAQKLMEMYGVSEQAIKAADVSESGAASSVQKQPPAWEQRLAGIISAAFCTRVIYYSMGYAQKGEWRFIGVGAAAEVSSYTFDVLLRQLKKARQHHITTRCPNVKRETKILRGDLFCEGWIGAVSQQVSAIAENFAHQEAIQSYLAEKHPSLGKLSLPQSNRREPNYYDWQSHNAGARAGRDVSLNMGVDTQQEEQRYLGKN